jgi:hypothetical protein
MPVQIRGVTSFKAYAHITREEMRAAVDSSSSPAVPD